MKNQITLTLTVLVTTNLPVNVKTDPLVEYRGKAYDCGEIAEHGFGYSFPNMMRALEFCSITDPRKALVKTPENSADPVFWIITMWFAGQEVDRIQFNLLENLFSGKLNEIKAVFADLDKQCEKKPSTFRTTVTTIGRIRKIIFEE